MREGNKRPRIHNVGLGTSDMDSPPPWLKHARNFIVEKSVAAEESYTITGFPRFSGAQGTEDQALIKAVKKVDPSISVENHHKNEYTFVTLSPENSRKVQGVLRGWGYSSKNRVDILRESLYR